MPQEGADGSRSTSDLIAFGQSVPPGSVFPHLLARPCSDVRMHSSRQVRTMWESTKI